MSDELVGYGKPMYGQSALFNAEQTQPKKCVRGCKHKNLCDHDANIAHGMLAGKRPRTCLNSYDPKEGVIPF